MVLDGYGTGAGHTARHIWVDVGCKYCDYLATFEHFVTLCNGSAQFRLRSHFGPGGVRPVTVLDTHPQLGALHKIHMKQNPFLCPRCSHGFKSSSALLSHMNQPISSCLTAYEEMLDINEALMAQANFRMSRHETPQPLEEYSTNMDIDSPALFELLRSQRGEEPGESQQCYDHVMIHSSLTLSCC